VLWKERNARIFDHKNDNIHHLLDNIKAQSFGRLKTKYNNLAFDYNSGGWVRLISCEGSLFFIFGLPYCL